MDQIYSGLPPQSVFRNRPRLLVRTSSEECCQVQSNNEAELSTTDIPYGSLPSENVTKLMFDENLDTPESTPPQVLHIPEEFNEVLRKLSSSLCSIPSPINEGS